MNFKFNHNNLNVRDLEKSIQFYKDALGLTVVREKDAADGSFKLVYLGDGSSVHQLELTWLRDMDRPYDLGDNEIHLAFTVDDMDAANVHAHSSRGSYHPCSWHCASLSMNAIATLNFSFTK